jgi:glycosyltransferase involved in cell wall biosynthesis
LNLPVREPMPTLVKAGHIKPADMASKAAEQPDGPTPLLSVIMPMLNARPFLDDSINSILSQTFRAFELIIVDNGSSDGSKVYAESFSDPRIRVLVEARTGAAFAINAGIAVSRADLIAIMDADDISAPDRLSIQCAYMRDHPDTVLLGTRFSFLVGQQVVPAAPPLIHHRQIRRALLQGSAVISEGSTMFRAAAAKAVGGHKLNGPAHDFDFFLRMSEIGIVHNLPTALYYYRLHAASSTMCSTAIITEHKMFAVACAIARGAGVPEPVFADFRREWQIRPRLIKLADRARDMSSRIYKNAIIQRAGGKLVSSGLGVVCSALLNPRVAIWHIRRRLSSFSIPTHAADRW